MTARAIDFTAPVDGETHPTHGNGAMLEPPPGRFDDDAPDPEPRSGEVAEPYAQYKAREGEGRAASLRIWTPAEIWAPLEPPQFRVAGVFVRGSLGLVVALGSSLKTWMALDLLLACATGGEWLGRFACESGRALFVDYESGDYEVRRRLHRLASGRGLALPVEGVAFVSMPPSPLTDEAFLLEIERLAAIYGVIVIDSLAGGSGGVDENEAKFAKPLYRLKSIAARTGCVILLLHHAKKAAPGKDVDPREMVRGSTAIFNACDVVLQLARSEDEAFRTTQTKARGGKAVGAFVVRVDDVSDVGSVVVATESREGDASSGSKSLGEAKARILRLLGSDRDVRSKNEIHRRIKGTKPTNLKAVAELEERDLIALVDGCYRLTSEVR